LNKRHVSSVAAAALTSLFSVSSEAASQLQRSGGPCADAKHHQLDFWIGHWDVFDHKGHLVAHSLIEPVYGCGIRENWMPLNNQPGGSLSIFVPEKRRWEQFWIDSSGARVIFTGGWTGRAMILTGRWGGPLVRMTYSRNANGSVRQLGEQSVDHSKSWKSTFDFTYRPSRERQ
jgi:hypothetical protein